jgi:transcription initiation factor IIE alpha subunit
MLKQENRHEVFNDILEYCEEDREAFVEFFEELKERYELTDDEFFSILGIVRSYLGAKYGQFDD